MNEQDRIRLVLDRLSRQDGQLWAELAPATADVDAPPMAAAVGADGFASPLAKVEAIVLRTGRPVLAIRDSQAVLDLEPAESSVWQQRLATAAPQLHQSILAIGRVEITGHPFYEWVGTGWLVAPDIVVTNRHVARLFTRQSGGNFQFAFGADGLPMSGQLDYLKEIGSADSRPVRLTRVLHVEDDDGPDLAFFQVARDTLASPIPLSDSVRPLQYVATVGYPARDSRIPDTELMDRLYGNIYDRKRLAPGQIVGRLGAALTHDCTTLGGNSGSAVLDLETGHAVAIHFAGRFLEANYAVPAALIGERLQRVMRGVPAPKPIGTGTADPPAKPDVTAPAPVAQQPIGQTVPVATATASTVTLTIPLQISVSLGVPLQVGQPAGAVQAPQASLGSGAASPGGPGAGAITDDDETFEEGRSDDYVDRRGYDADFIPGAMVPLPSIVRGRADILAFAWKGRTDETVLTYEHFSVVMNRRRRMCVFSAVNIDGATSVSSKRGGWRLDPRIPRETQIMNECYGSPPRFSRGHMTRREDPAWGDSASVARGNQDSMHVTNTVPQMQTLNGGIWLRLEDYALKNARRDQMRISVFTGPVLRDDDPVRYGVAIPQAFWKVIAFINDNTGKLSATGYSISQQADMPEEFVFGAFETYQRSLDWIERASGLRFDVLRDADRFGAEEAAGGGPLQFPEQIRW